MKKTILTTLLCLMAIAMAWAEDTSKIYTYLPGDGGILYSMTHGNRWAITNLGTSASGGDAASGLFDMDNGECINIVYNFQKLHFNMASNDGNIVVGDYMGQAMSYNRSTRKMTRYANRPLWKNGQLVDCTPDGRYAVGYYEGYLGKGDDSDIPNDWYYRTLFVDTETGDTIHTPNLPTTNRNGGRLQSIKFTSITPDGRYISGSVDWYLDNGYSFLYDTQTKRVIQGTSLMQLYGGDVASRHEGVVSCSGSMLSPSGTAIGGTARINRKNADGTTEQVSCRCVWFRETDELRCYPDAEDGGVSIYEMDDNGTYYGCTETGTPLRELKILYNGKYWVTLNQICTQRYGYDFYERTGFERTGTIMGVSANGHRLIAFPDPMGESYCFDFGESAEEACSHLDFLGTYTITPEAGSQFAMLNSVELKFERPIAILGSGKNVHLIDSKGTVVANGLTTTQGLMLKADTENTVVANFRSRILTPGEQYYVVFDAGAVATRADLSCVNEEIRIPYTGRENGPVRLTAALPEEHSQLQKLDNSSYIILSFESKVKLTNNAQAYVERVEDGTRAASLMMVAGTIESTKNQVLLYPASTLPLFNGKDYRIVVEAGSVVDYSGNATSANERIELTYHGTYLRENPSGNILFKDSWDDIAESLQIWLRYEGDHNIPQQTPQSWEFDADNQPWNFSIRESNENPDYCAGSHSMYTPAGRSDDWMLTPQVSVPAQGECRLDFDAQGYLMSARDTLEVYIYENEEILTHLTTPIMNHVKQNSTLVLKEIISAGRTPEGLSGEWTHFTIDLSPWANKDIYIAFANHNFNQSAVFVDNVIVQRTTLCQLLYDYEDRVLNRESQKISGHVILPADSKATEVTLRLINSEGNTMETLTLNTAGTPAGSPVAYAFQNPLPLIVGEVNNYAIEVVIDGQSVMFNESITDLAFEPVKRVVIEEMTGTTCPNCPLGIVTLEKLHKIYGDNIIPVGIHTYPGDMMGNGLMDYSNFLGLMSAPSARINRQKGIYYPIKSLGSQYVDTDAGDPLWLDIVTEEMNRLPLCDISVKASNDELTSDIRYEATVRYAVNAHNQQLAVFFVVLEDGLSNMQQNNFGQASSPLLGQWGQGGIYSDYVVLGYEHNHVARGTIGNTYGGTIGLLPTSPSSGTEYTAVITAPLPKSVVDVSKTTVVGMLIDTQTGEVINAASARLNDSGEGDGIETIGLDGMSNADSRAFNLLGQPVHSAAKGLIIRGGKKVIVK